MNFFINRAMGIGNSGVEHAQFYRAKRFDAAQLPYRFVFTELVPELHEAMTAWHLTDAQVINMWAYFVFGWLTKSAPATQTARDKVIIDETDTHRLKTTWTSSGMKIVETLVKYPSKKQDILLVSTARVELFDAKSGVRKVMYQILDDPHRTNVISNIHLFDELGQHLFFRNEVLLQRYFFAQLDKAFGGQSVFIIDRGEASEAALYYHKLSNSKVIDVIHADHLSDRDDPKRPLWNNYYEYLLTHLDCVDRVVVATDLQRDDLLKDFPKAGHKFVTIPVGGVRDKGTPQPLAQPMKASLKLLTMSRLATEKHIDLVIKAVAQLHETGVAVQFDIYGQGSETEKLQALIDSLQATEYVSLKGLTQEAQQVYPQYNAFVSASFSEGFGLTYIEALNAGLPVVTFKARFGALALIKDGENGFLQAFKRDDEAFNVLQLVNGLKRLLAADWPAIQQNALHSVSDYADSHISAAWRRLINGL